MSGLHVEKILEPFDILNEFLHTLECDGNKHVTIGDLVASDAYKMFKIKMTAKVPFPQTILAAAAEIIKAAELQTNKEQKQ